MLRLRTAAVAFVGLAAGGMGLLLYTSTAGAAETHRDAAYGISASGAAPIGATPAVSSTDGTTKTASGGARSSDGTITLGSATVRAGGGKASADVSGFSAFGLVTASKATANCTNGVVSSSVSGTPAGSVGRNAKVAYGVKSTNADGTTTIVAMRVTITAGAGTEAATINVAVATCGKTGGPPQRPDGDADERQAVDRADSPAHHCTPDRVAHSLADRLADNQPDAGSARQWRRYTGGRAAFSGQDQGAGHRLSVIC